MVKVAKRSASENITFVRGRYSLLSASKHDNVLLFIKNKEMIVTFDTDIEEEHSAIVEDILANCNFLTT